MYGPGYSPQIVYHGKKVNETLPNHPVGELLNEQWW
jgi:hypothetical protein